MASQKLPIGIQSFQEIRTGGYANKCQADSRKIYEIGIIFDPGSKNIQIWEVGKKLFKF